jgi:hypothetical protein
MIGMNYDNLRKNIIATYRISKSRNWFIKSDLEMDVAATIDEVIKLENSIGKKLPSQLKDLLTNLSKSVNLYYQIESEEIPSEFGQIFSGEFWYNLKLIENLNKDFKDWISASLDESVNDIESIEITKRIKDNKTVFLAVSTGDLIAIDDETNEVIYFDHEGDSMHGKTLAKDLNTFLVQWSQMGFFGTEGWQFEEIYDFENERLKSINDTKVINWIKWLYMKEL